MFTLQRKAPECSKGWGKNCSISHGTGAEHHHNPVHLSTVDVYVFLVGGLFKFVISCNCAQDRSRRSKGQFEKAFSSTAFRSRLHVMPSLPRLLRTASVLISHLVFSERNERAFWRPEQPSKEAHTAPRQPAQGSLTLLSKPAPALDE